MKTESGTDLNRAVEILRSGRPVALPTETVYGLAARIDHPEAIEAIFRAKNRPFSDPLIVHVSGPEEIPSLVRRFPPQAAWLFEAFSPGPLTVLLEKSDRVPDRITAGSPLVAIRIPDHELTLEVIRRLGIPVAAPSANPFGGISPTTAAHVLRGLEGKIPYVLDGGPCRVGLESTIVRILPDGSLRVLREGGIPREDLETVAGWPLSHGQPVTAAETVPGSMKSHYAPGKPVFLLSEGLPAAYPTTRLGFLGFSESHPGIRPENQVLLSPRGDLNEAARGLFSGLTSLDQNPDVEAILVADFPETGLGRAIRDRLQRASAKAR
jgi:L-threonylcarbamoyladenylate synthase